MNGAAVRQAITKYEAGRFQRWQPATGLAASLLAVWCQILLVATIAAAPFAVAADPLAGAPICHVATESDNGPPAQHKPNHPSHHCVLCVLCLAHASAVPILAATPNLLERRSIATVRLDAAQPRAPPVRPVAAAQPRGPPSLI
ncbi:MAG: DUF2946 family protein [Nevskiales bacterium]